MNLRLIYLCFILLAEVGCKADNRQFAFSFEVYTTKETRYEVVSLVEKFALREHLIQSRNYRIPTPDEPSVSINFLDEAQKIAWMFVDNGNLKNKDHVEVQIYPLSETETCEICRKFEASDEMKKIQEKFEIKHVVKNGKW
ncbi:hypothetical protein [Methylomicrobium lacus]|uniref:hypothetical protein n=1 Tax=Methylomicrobium lacus TaxID=136992 RepID=UPI00045E76CE|nr:hypothetical protein [Methylomicrobium lacus]